MLADERLLLSRLLQDALRDDVRRGLLGDDDLREAVAHAPQRLGDEAEARVVEDLLLNAEDDAHAALRAHFAECAEELQVEHDLPLVARAQIREELVHNNEIATVAVLGGERLHDVADELLVVHHRREVRHLEVDATTVEVVLNVAAENVAQRHGHAADLHAQHFELARDGLYRLCEALVLQVRKVRIVVRHGGDDRHQVRLTGSVVAHHEDALVVDDLIHL